jgi:uncharacterized protein (TIGR03086 family)
MTLPDQPAQRHRQVAGAFTGLVRGTTGWDAPAPVPGWTARSVVGHLTGWFPAFLGAGGIELPGGPGVDADPAGGWQAQVEAVQALLDDPGSSERVFAHPHTGELPLAQAIDRFYTADVFMHTWDLARATGQDDRLDPSYCAELLAGMRTMEAVIRASGQYGPAVPVPADADVQTRLLGFIGREPSWQPS